MPMILASPITLEHNSNAGRAALERSTVHCFALKHFHIVGETVFNNF
jgi:hypothetical protein